VKVNMQKDKTYAELGPKVDTSFIHFTQIVLFFAKEGRLFLNLTMDLIYIYNGNNCCMNTAVVL
jgi:hypothetical protein